MIWSVSLHQRVLHLNSKKTCRKDCPPQSIQLGRRRKEFKYFFFGIKKKKVVTPLKQEGRLGVAGASRGVSRGALERQLGRSPAAGDVAQGRRVLLAGDKRLEEARRSNFGNQRKVSQLQFDKKTKELKKG